MSEELKKYLDMYENNLYRNDCSKLTIMDFKRQLLKWFIYQNINSLDDLKQVSSLDLEQYDSKLKQDGKSSNTRNTYIKPIGLFYKYLQSHDIVESNPLNFAIKTKNKNEVVWLDVENTKTFLDNCKKLRDKAMFSLICDTGMRFCEFSNIKISDLKIDEENKTYLVTVLGKGSKYRTLGFSEETYKNIKNYIENERINCDNDILFITKEGKQLQDNAVNYSLKSILKKAGLPQISVHKLRHGFCSAMINKGVDVKTAQTILGHSSSSTTLRIYTHVDKSKTAENMCGLNLYQ